MKGVVTDEDGESIIGATVMIGGTSKGTVTDINGQYTLEVQSGDLVSFTFVGMTDKVIKAQVNHVRQQIFLRHYKVWLLECRRRKKRMEALIF